MPRVSSLKRPDSTESIPTPEQLSQTVFKSIQHLSVQHAYDYVDKLQNLLESLKDAFLDSGAVSHAADDADIEDWSAEELGEDEDDDCEDDDDDDCEYEDE